MSLQFGLYEWFLLQVADAANTAAFQCAVAEIAEWASNSGVAEISSVTIDKQDALVTQLLRQWILYRYIIKIGQHNIELCCFKVGAFF